MTRSNSLYENLPKPPPLRRTVHVGHMPVPWVTCYNDTTTSTHRRRLPTPLGVVETCDCVLGVGKPALGTQCPIRQRIAMTQRRCNACGTRIKGVALFAGVFANQNRAGVPAGTPITAEAPTHPRCLAYSALACPALFASNDCIVAPVTGDYPLLDQWRPDRRGERPARELVPHGTRRPMITNDGAWLIHDYVYARLDRPGQQAIRLDHWMQTSAPQPYRDLWSELVKTGKHPDRHHRSPPSRFPKTPNLEEPMDRKSFILATLANLTFDELETATQLVVSTGSLGQVRKEILEDLRAAVRSAYEVNLFDENRATDRAPEVSTGLRRSLRSTDYAVIDNAQRLTMDDITGGDRVPGRSSLRDLVDMAVQRTYDDAVSALITYLENAADEDTDEDPEEHPVELGDRNG